MRLELQNNESHNDIPGVTAVFIFAAAIHIVLQFTVFNFSRSVIVYPDELRYYEIARSLFNSHSIQIRGIDSNFQKIGYSLILAPLFAIHDVVLRLKITGILNAIIMSLSVIPVWLICRELKLNKRLCYVIAFFTAIYPDMMYSMTYMSEVLYWPVLLIYIYIRMINERRNSYIISVIEGLVCYFGYLTKEIFLAFLLASVLFEIIYPMLNYYIFPENRAGRKLKDFYSRKIFIKIFIFTAVFMLCHIAMKVSLFRGMGNSYNQMGIEAVMSPYKFMYCVYAFFHYIAALIAASLVIPFVYPAVNFKSMNENSQKLFCYIILFSLIISAVVAYIISVREDLGFEYARIHLRYYAAAFIILLAVFSSCMQDLNSDHEIHEIIRKRNRTFIEFLVLVIVYLFFMFKGVRMGSAVDQFILFWYIAIEQITGSLALPESNGIIFYPAAFFMILILISISVLFHRILLLKGTKQALRKFFAVLFISYIGLNSAAGYVIYRLYSADTDAVNEVIAINNYFNERDEAKIIYFVRKDENKTNDGRLIDTYMDRRKNLYYVRLIDLAAQKDGNSIKISDTDIHEDLFKNIYETADRIDYIIIKTDDESDGRKFLNVEIVPELTGKHFTVYKNLNPSVIQFED